ncbi:MAG: hypothetical protein E6G36_12020 [Actinobacteria bacterium]|nr:MAG: hypothetical protein E6G36_12020 [Actinomycetota bacterium]
MRVVVAGEDEEGRAAGAPAAFLLDDLLEAPVRVGAAGAVQGRRGERRGLTERGRQASLQRVALQSGGGATQADARPAPGAVDIVREGDPEGWAGEPERAAQSFERWVEWVEARPLGAETSVLVPRPVALLDAGEMEERLGEPVPGRALAALDLLPGRGVIGNVVSEAELRRADRVEHPAGPALDVCRDHGRARRATRARWTSPGFASSRAKTAST